MEWQGSKYGFLHIPDCWSRLSGSDSLPQSWIAWRKDYPVKVAVIDSGIKRDHQAFAHIPGAEIQGKNFISPDDNIDDDDSNEKGHGTKCAAIIAGGCYMAEKYEKEEKSAAPLKFWNGVAPFVNLYICKTDCIVDAINHLVEEKKNNGLQHGNFREMEGGALFVDFPFSPARREVLRFSSIPIGLNCCGRPDTSTRIKTSQHEKLLAAGFPRCVAKTTARPGQTKRRHAHSSTHMGPTHRRAAKDFKDFARKTLSL
ncbi:hypothetical protein Bbelb_288000 [Branchiostoma belcheri]|nr:hypothetical protein Bbelb_288000 [Branchiostoma belcheri]